MFIIKNIVKSFSFCHHAYLFCLFVCLKHKQIVTMSDNASLFSFFLAVVVVVTGCYYVVLLLFLCSIHDE